MKTIRHQRGVALFITLLVVTIATLLATEMWFKNTLDISRQINNRSAYQAEHYAKGMVLWAKDVLRMDFEEDPRVDTKIEAWNQTIAGIQTEDALLSGKLTDLSAKFNLNNLVIRDQLNQPSYEYFIRILTNLQMDIGIADKIIDWMDADSIPRPLGAEDAVYLSKRPAYRTSSQAFNDITELRLIDGIDERTYQRLKSFVTAYPVLGNVPSKLNVNTTSTLLLLSIDNQIQKKDALLLYQEGQAVYKDLTDFFQQPAIQFYNLSQNPQLSQLLDVKSQWFQAKVVVKMEQAVFQKFALLLRNGSALALVRQFSDVAFD